MEQSNRSCPTNSLSDGEPSIPPGATIPRWQIWAWWLLATAVGVALGFPSWEEIWGKGGDLWGVFPSVKSQAALGLTMGMAQSLVLLRLGCLRRRSLVDLQWIAATVVGMLLGGFATGIVRVTLAYPIRELWGYGRAVDFYVLSWPFLCGLMVSALQQDVLRLDNPLRWVLPSAVGWLAGFAVGAIPALNMPVSSGIPAFQVLGPAGTGIIVGIVTGSALIWLLAHPARPDGGSPPDESPAITPMT